MKFFRCDICGNFVEMLEESGVSMVCCGQNMTEVVPATTDEAHEKHVPVCSVAGNRVTVTVGEVEHPMLEKHYIQWILLETNRGTHKMMLKPNDPPKATFLLAEGENIVAVYSYCNIHGLWKTEKC